MLTRVRRLLPPSLLEDFTCLTILRYHSRSTSLSLSVQVLTATQIQGSQTKEARSEDLSAVCLEWLGSKGKQSTQTASDAW